MKRDKYKGGIYAKLCFTTAPTVIFLALEPVMDEDSQLHNTELILAFMFPWFISPGFFTPIF